MSSKGFFAQFAPAQTIILYPWMERDTLRKTIACSNPDSQLVLQSCNNIKYRTLPLWLPIYYKSDKYIATKMERRYNFLFFSSFYKETSDVQFEVLDNAKRIYSTGVHYHIFTCSLTIYGYADEFAT